MIRFSRFCPLVRFWLKILLHFSQLAYALPVWLKKSGVCLHNIKIFQPIPFYERDLAEIFFVFQPINRGSLILAEMSVFHLRRRNQWLLRLISKPNVSAGRVGDADLVLRSTGPSGTRRLGACACCLGACACCLGACAGDINIDAAAAFPAVLPVCFFLILIRTGAGTGNASGII